MLPLDWISSRRVLMLDLVSGKSAQVFLVKPIKEPLPPGVICVCCLAVRVLQEANSKADPSIESAIGFSPALGSGALPRSNHRPNLPTYIAFENRFASTGKI